MTDKKSETSQASDAATSKPASGAATTPITPKSTTSIKKTRSGLIWALVVVVLIALLLAGGLWYQQQDLKKSNAQLAEQAQRSASLADQAGQQARQALSLIKEQSAQLASLETTTRESKAHVQSLEQAFQTLTDSGSDLVLVNDIDHLVTIAQQQLQLSGNVGNAIISLETAQAQLARANRPTLASLQQTVNGDLDRLRAASTIDVAMLSTELDELATLVSQAALMVPDDAVPGLLHDSNPSTAGTPATPALAVPENAPWWQKGIATATHWSSDAWSAIRQDLGQFIIVRRADDPTALLMSPDQATRFRENLRLRIMTAQLALMMRQPKVWHSEIDSLVKALETRYDGQDARTRQALKLVRQLADTRIDVKLPTVENSLQAIEAVREASVKAAQDSASINSQHNGEAQDMGATQENEKASAPEATSAVHTDSVSPAEVKSNEAPGSAPRNASVENGDAPAMVPPQPATAVDASPTTPRE